MKYPVILFPLLFCGISLAYSQTTFPQEKINQAMKDMLPEKSVTSPGQFSSNEKLLGSPAHYFEQFPYHRPINISQPKVALRDYDTLVIGVVPHDTLVINGTWLNDGPIIVLNDGVLIFQNAQATINGDLYVLNHA